MDIYLNGQALDFRLESERTLAQVSSAVEDWLAGGGLCLVGLTVDGRDVGWGVGGRWADLPLEGIGRLDLAVAPLGDARIATLRTTAQYLRLLAGALETKDQKLLGDLATGYPSMMEGVRTLLSPQPADALYGHLVNLDRMVAGNTPGRIAAWSEEALAAALASIAGLQDAVTAKTREWDDPRAALGAIRRSLEEASAQAAEVSVLMQTGREREAMSRVISFTSLAQSHLAVVQRILVLDGVSSPAVDGEPLHVFGEKLNGFLQQLLEAFRARDTVLIGDLLEYEVAPRVRKLTESTAGLERPAATGS